MNEKLSLKYCTCFAAYMFLPFVSNGRSDKNEFKNAKISKAQYISVLAARRSGFYCFAQLITIASYVGLSWITNRRPITLTYRKLINSYLLFPFWNRLKLDEKVHILELKYSILRRNTNRPWEAWRKPNINPRVYSVLEALLLRWALSKSIEVEMR